MSIIFSKKCEYGLQAVLYLSSINTQPVVSAEEIAKTLYIPKEFVSKILQELTASGIVASKKGKNGGFTLNKALSDIRLIDIVAAIDGFDIFNKCVMGFPNCSSESPCPVHERWSALSKETYTMLSEETLEDFLAKTKHKIQSIQK
ncbi:MAG: Rrf2 family transcriptional regulator [Ignavibacteriales bacterium]|nr:Rrf2 family transcriptional regulator [Ignavibacteriales bacterium]